MNSQQLEEIRIQGIAASPGIIMGRVFLMTSQTIEIEAKKLAECDVDKELLKFNNALCKAKSELEQIYDKAVKTIGEDGANIFNVHQMLLEDPLIIDETKRIIKTECVNCDYAFDRVMTTFESRMSQMDEFFKSRIADLRDLRRRVIRLIQGTRSHYSTRLSEPSIIFAKELNPSDTINLDHSKILGFAMDFGARTSHATILARSISVPAVVGLNEASESLKKNSQVILDGIEGLLIINPTTQTIDHYKKKRLKYDQEKAKLGEIIPLPAITRDGKQIELASNIEFPNEVESILRLKGDGIGLYRTEYLYLSEPELPSEDKQFEEYKMLAEHMQGKPVIIRTFDLGGDKPPQEWPLPVEANPFLGVRGVRLYDQHYYDIFKTQLRAIVRASAYGKMRIMFPMISCVDEMRACKDAVELAKQEIRDEGHPVAEDLPLGAMIEVPSAAIVADLIAQECDFFSIGTNDLIQYTMAVDRGNKNLSHLYQPYNPALLRLLQDIIHQAHKKGIWVGVCGEMASDPLATMILIGMGLDEFSVSPVSHLLVKEIIRQVDYSDCEKLTHEALRMSTAEEIENYIKTEYRKNFPSHNLI